MPPAPPVATMPPVPVEPPVATMPPVPVEPPVAGAPAAPVVPATPPVPVVPPVSGAPAAPVVPPVPPIVWQVALQVVPFGGSQVSPGSTMPLPQVATLSHLMVNVATVLQEGEWLSDTVRVNVWVPEARHLYDEPAEVGVVKFAAGAQA